MRIVQCIRASSNRSVARAAMIGLLMSVAVALIVVNRPDSRAAEDDSASTQASATSTFAVYAPYWSTEPGFVSTIEMMNYRVDEPLTITPVLYPLGGGEIVLDPVILNPSETRLLNINEALAARGETATVGAAEIRYNHITEAVFGANLTAVNVDKSLIYSAPLHGPEDTEQLEGIWWFWDSGTDGFVAVQNARAENITVTPTLYAQEHAYQLDSLQLSPHEMKLINLRQTLRSFGLEAAKEGGIQLVSSVAGAVVAAGSLDNPAIGFSAPIRMGNPQLEAERSKPLATARKLHALNLSIGAPPPEMGLPPTTVFKPVVVLRNVARSVVQVQPVFRYQVGNSQRSFALPTVRLNSQQTVKLDLLGYWQSGEIPHEVSTGSLELRYTGKPGSLFGSATSVDQTGTFVLDARIDNHLAAGFAGEFWCIEGDNNTFVSVKNISGSAATCSISLRYDAGRGIYEMEPMTLQAGEMRVINLKRLQAERIPGVNGEILPERAAFGGMKFVEEPGGKRFLVEGGVFNPVTGTCGVCGFGCLYPLSLLTIPGGLDLVVGLISNGLSVQANMCDGTTQQGWQCYCDYLSGNTSVATINEFCTHFVTGVSPGSTFTNGTAVDVPGPHCGEQTLFTSCQVRIKPAVSSLLASMPSTKNPVTGQAPADGTVTVTNTTIAFAAATSSDLIALFQSSTVQMTVTANQVNPPSAASQLRWKLDRDPSDTVAAGLPGLSASIGAQVSITPTTAGNFRLICYYDTNANSAYDTGEDIRVLRFAVVRATVTTGTTASYIDTGGVGFTGQATSGNYSLSASPPAGAIMLLQCKIVLEGGGSSRTIGVSQMQIGNIGNLRADSATVSYSVSGTATESPGASLPMVDTGNVSSGQEPTGGDSAFRASSSFSSTSGPSGNGRTITVISDDDPGFGPWSVAHPTNGHTWATTQGGYDFREFIVGYSNSFPRSYVVFATGDWTLRVNGTNSGGTWSNNGSAITLQGSSSHPQALTVTVSSGSPQPGDAAGLQPLGLSYATNHSFSYAP